MNLNESIRQILIDLAETVKDVLPIAIIAVAFQVFVIGQLFADIVSLSLGMLLVIAGLFLFLMGLKIGVFPLGEGLAYQFVRQGSLPWLLIFGFAITFSTVMAEPAVMAIAIKAEMVSEGRVDDIWFKITVASAAGLSVSAGIIRSVLGHPIHLYLIPGYILIIIATAFAPREIIALAYDAGGVTTSTITVPLVTAIGVGLASSIRGRDPLVDGFGLVGFAVMMPILFMMGYGIIAYYGVTPVHASITVNTVAETVKAEQEGIMSVMLGFITIIKDILPLAAAILIFQIFVLKQKIPNAARVMVCYRNIS